MFYLIVRCMISVLSVTLQPLFQRYGSTEHLHTGIIFYMAYSCAAVIAHLILLVIILSLGLIKNPQYDTDDLGLFVILYSFHISTHFVVTFDWYMLLLKIMQLS